MSYCEPPSIAKRDPTAQAIDLLWESRSPVPIRAECHSSGRGDIKTLSPHGAESGYLPMGMDLS